MWPQLAMKVTHTGRRQAAAVGSQQPGQSTATADAAAAAAAVPAAAGH
jgi:hypothetical protein